MDAHGGKASSQCVQSDCTHWDSKREPFGLQSNPLTHTLTCDISKERCSYSQADAVLLRQRRHLLLQLLKRLVEQHRPRHHLGPLVPPLKLIWEVQLERDTITFRAVRRRF